MPKVSVVMSVLNGELYLADSLKSVLLQSFGDFEFVIANDGSTDRTEKILAGFRDPRIRVLHQETRGLAASLNRCVDEARGEYIARMDADDFSYPGRLAQQVRFLDEHPDHGLVGCYYHLIGPAGQMLGLQYRPVEDGDLQHRLLEANQFCHGAVLFRRSIFEEAGGYDPNYRFAQDYDLWLRIADSSKLFNLPKVLYAWRFTAENQSEAKVSEQLRIAAEVQEKTRLRRAAGSAGISLPANGGGDRRNGNGRPASEVLSPVVLFTDAANPMSHRLAHVFRSTFDRNAPCDLVYARSDSAPPAVIAAKKHAGVRVVHNLAGILFPAVDPQYRQSNAVLKQIRDELADFVIYQSEFARRACEEFIGPAPCPWEIVPNAVDETRFSPPARKGRRNVLLTVGLHRHEQRFRAILNALPAIRREVPDVRLIIAGPIRAEGPGAVLELIRERITTLGLADCVEMTGPVPQERLPDLYRSANVFLHPSSIDGCPKVVIEAMACGLPVAHALHGGTPELVGEAGIGVPVDAPSWERIPEIDPEAYAEAVLRILKEEERFSRKARERVLERYTLSRAVEVHRRIFERVLADPPRGDGVLRTRHPVFHHRFDPVQVPRLEFEGQPVTYVRAFLMDYTRRMADRFSGFVMDVGAGQWTYPRSLFPHCRYWTLDVIPERNVDLVADLVDLPVAEDSVDGILCHQVLEHTTDPFRVVREIHRVLRPGGCAIFSTPFLYPIHEDGPVKDYWRFTERGLRELAKGFREIEIEGVGPQNFPFTYCVFCRK